MKVGVIGVGRLGLALALNLSVDENTVLVNESSALRRQEINSGEINTIEPEINNLLKARKITFVDLREILRDSDIIFITVRTEGNNDGSYDCSQVFNLMNQIKTVSGDSESILVINCNVNVGTVDRCQNILKDTRLKLAYSPEWVAQGSIVKNQLYPEVLVIGTQDKSVQRVILECYLTYIINKPTPIFMSTKAAEATKILLNSYLTMKISFANLAGDILTKMGCEVDAVLNAIGSDSRIGSKYLGYGFGYGGPCFPRDIAALQALCKEIGIIDPLPKAVSASNEQHFLRYAQKLADECKDNIVTLETLSYKPGIDLFDFSEQLRTAIHLADQGYSIKVENGTKGQRDYIEANYEAYLKNISFNIR